MIALNHDIINRQAGNLESKGIIYCWETYKFRSIEIFGNRKQCLQYCLNAFYHDVDYLKEATILWLVAHWVQCPVMHINDNAFISNRMLGCDTAFYDDVDNKWQFARVNDLSATCYIKYINKYCTYI